ncbi:MAG: hypothetical protein ACLRMJ_08710 [Alistipes finegoldii]
MKKILLCLLALAAGLTAFGQNESSFGVRAGLNVANLHLSAGPERVAGLARLLSCGLCLSAAPAAGASPISKRDFTLGRGASVTAGDLDLGVEGKAKFNMLYLQVPAVVSWHFNIKSVSIQPAAGVYYGFGIHGKLRATPRKSICSRRFQCPSRTAPLKAKCSNVPISDCASA